MINYFFRKINQHMLCKQSFRDATVKYISLNIRQNLISYLANNDTVCLYVTIDGDNKIVKSPDREIIIHTSIKKQ